MKNYMKVGIAISYIIVLVAVLYVLSTFTKEDHTFSYSFEDFTSSAEDEVSITSEGITFDAEDAKDYNYVSSSITILNSGNYILSVDYETVDEQYLMVQASRTNTFTVPLKSGQKHIDFPFTLESKSDVFKIRFMYSGSEKIEINQVSISSDKPLYTDMWYFIIVLLLVQIPLVILYLKRKNMFKEKEQFVVLLVLAGVFLIACIPMMQHGLALSSDIRGQLLRIEGIRDGLAERQFPVIINSNFDKGYGEAACLYPNMFLYIPAVLRLLGVSAMTAYKTLFVLQTALTLYCMYVVAKSLGASRITACITASFYCMIPNRIIQEICLGTTAGTGFVFAFMPLFLAGIYHVFLGDRKKWTWLVLGLTGLCEAHIIGTFLAIIIAILCFICFIKNIIVEKRYKELAVAVICFLAINICDIATFAYYFNSAMDFKKMGEYPFSTFLQTPAMFFTNSRAYTLLIGLILMMAYLIINRKQKTVGYRFTLFYTIFSGILTFGILKYFPWKLLEQFGPIDWVLRFIQSIDRFYSILPIGMCLAFAIIMTEFKLRYWKQIVGALTIVLAIATIYEYSVYFTEYPPFMTRMTGEMENNVEDYLPPGTKTEYYQYYIGRVSNEEVINSIAFEQQGTRAVYTYTTDSEKEYMEVPLFYYPGYKAVDENGTVLKVVNGNENRVRTYLPKAEKEKTVFLYFEVPKLVKVTLLISWLSGLVFIIYIIRNLYFFNKRRVDKSLS